MSRWTRPAEGDSPITTNQITALNNSQGMCCDCHEGRLIFEQLSLASQMATCPHCFTVFVMAVDAHGVISGVRKADRIPAHMIPHGVTTTLGDVVSKFILLDHVGGNNNDSAARAHEVDHAREQRRTEEREAARRARSASAILCGHANESPNTDPCDCPNDCYCKVHGNCRPLFAQSAPPPPPPSIKITPGSRARRRIELD